MPLKPSDFDYNLPQHLIASDHTEPRDHSRLMVVNRQTGQIEHHHFYDLVNYLNSGDVLVLNQTKVFPARLFGQKPSGGQVEALLLERLNLNTWRSITKPGLKIDQIIDFPQGLSATVVGRDIATGETDLFFNHSGTELLGIIDQIGITPLPHYINTSASEDDIRRQYQTVYAQDLGSAAAPTAGLHFTDELLDRLTKKGIQIEKIILHVGLGTFQPLREENLKSGKLHQEKYFIADDVADRLNTAKSSGQRIIAVGTTTTRSLESNILLDKNCQKLTPGWFSTDLFIHPPYKFNFVDSLVTNFHLPQSSLLMMITAFTSSPNHGPTYTSFNESLAGQIYRTAVSQSYRFFSFGDAMLLI